MEMSMLISCEHAGNEIPPGFEYLFEGQTEALQSHRGWDPGAYATAEFLAEGFRCSLFACQVTRLLIEMNRSLDSSQLFSEFSVSLPSKIKEALIRDYHASYRDQIQTEIESLAKPVFHLSVHSFTPVLNNERRTVDIGLLFDPGRQLEQTICNSWKRNLEKELPDKKIRFNEPYKGTDDGLTTYLRTQFPDPLYAGIEVEVNQRFADSAELITIQRALLKCFPL